MKKTTIFKNLLASIGALSLVLAIFSFTQSKLEQSDQNMKYYLMIGKPTQAVWQAIIKNGGKGITDVGRKATEAAGGKMIGYYLCATEAKNYIIVAYPDSKDVSHIVYERAAQGVMDELEFIEIIPVDQASTVLEKIKLD